MSDAKSDSKSDSNSGPLSDPLPGPNSGSISGHGSGAMAGESKTLKINAADLQSLERLRRVAKRLGRDHAAGQPGALLRLKAYPPRGEGSTLRHADYLHVVAREAGFTSWPQLKFQAEAQGFDRAEAQQRLKIALFHGQNPVVEQLLQRWPDLADGLFGLQVALYDLAGVRAVLAQDPGAALRALGPRRPMLHLAFSKYIHAVPAKRGDMLAIAELLLAHGADVNDAMEAAPGQGETLSALYGALGHADNLLLAEWLLGHGADPNDGESLYHATELGHHDGLALLLRHGARPAGTNALLRALDFDNAEMVSMLLAAGADPNEAVASHVSGQPALVMPALHQAARRGCGRAVVELLLAAGADVELRHEGITGYARARVHGARAVAEALAATGADTGLNREEALLARAAEGMASEGQFIDMAKLAPAWRGLVGQLVPLAGRQKHIAALVALGVGYDVADDMGLTPVQIAGWEGKPELLSWFLSLKPDLTHVNNFGGTLLSTIIHGSENCPARERRAHVDCAGVVLHHGVALPRGVIRFAGEPAMAEFLAEWAEMHPGQVVDGTV
ncbi:ankyrin repeat domain-containing protein [Candidatus Halocynthiibacter alkanivorans]|uniref:ankyrin repeat domain-containing protein n=1 Tax=Candidatus Halocynthiibacter alkanivorans TaxID=2267619 RepID=UPI001F15F27B|nr:ankyrin repeat domain-containing protein [Candidatus Halocynthiibacter alkanivorans]